MGESVNDFIVRSVNETLARDNENKWFCRVAVLLKNEQNPLYPAARYAILDTEEKKPETYGLPFIMITWCFTAPSRSLVRVVGGYFLFPKTV